jgi:hypothetical protein
MGEERRGEERGGGWMFMMKRSDPGMVWFTDRATSLQLSSLEYKREQLVLGTDKQIFTIDITERQLINSCCFVLF